MKKHLIILNISNPNDFKYKTTIMKTLKVAHRLSRNRSTNPSITIIKYTSQTYIFVR